MKQVITLLVAGFGAYWILGQILQSQQRAAVASCGGGALQPAVCPALDKVNQNWKWYPQFYFGL